MISLFCILEYHHFPPRLQRHCTIIAKLFLLVIELLGRSPSSRKQIQYFFKMKWFQTHIWHFLLQIWLFLLQGLIQSIFELHDGSGVVVTIGKYITPNHIDINKNGIEPDFSQIPGTIFFSRCTDLFIQ